MTATELRCDSGVLFGSLDDGVIKVKCRHPSCGVDKQDGVVIIHHFSAVSGDLLETKMYRDPTHRKEDRDGARGHRASVRSA